MGDNVLVHFHYANEVRLDFPELDLAVVLKGRLKVAPGLRLPLRASMLKGDVHHLLHGKYKTSADLYQTYHSSIQDSRPGEYRFGSLKEEPLEIKEVRTPSKEGKQPPDDWLFGWVRYPSEGNRVFIELRGSGKLEVAGDLPEELADLPKYAHVHPKVLEAIAVGFTGAHTTSKLDEIIQFSYIRHAPEDHLGEIARKLADASRFGGLASISRHADPRETPVTPAKGYKQDDGKLDYNLLMRDLAPQVEQIVKVLHWGHHTKGYPRNGFRTLPDAEGRFMAATQRHLAAMARDALAKDPESGLPHAIHVIANQLMMLAALEDNQ
jgi:hypothetical protein